MPPPLPPPLPQHSESLASDNGNSRLSKVLPTLLGPASILLMLVLYLIYTWIKNRTKPNEEDKGAEVDTFEGGFAGVKYDEVLEETLIKCDGGVCSICFEEFNVGEKRGTLIKCHHEYHKLCLNRWLTNDKKNCCPTCRAFICLESIN